MTIIIFLILGLILGSFINALVWRIHEQANELAKPNRSQKYLKQLSITRGRSICPDCKHQLKARDLVPLLSWLTLKGRCRYCRKPISVQYPVVELASGLLFAFSYLRLRGNWGAAHTVELGLWLVLLAGLIGLFVYDFKWRLLPNRLVYPLTAVAALLAFTRIFSNHHSLHDLLQTALATLIGGGIFYIIYQVSAGKWIGGGDVKLGWLIGLAVGTPVKALLVIFLAALLGSLSSLPLLLSNRLKRGAVIAFGPFLIVGTIIAYFYGSTIINWYLGLTQIR